MGAPIMQEQERLLIGRITRLQTFTVREFGTRASFRLNARKAQSPAASPGRLPAELVTHYRESDVVAVTGISEPRPSTASAMTAWAGRVRVRTLRVSQVIWAAAWVQHSDLGNAAQTSRSDHRQEEGMCSPLLFPPCKARKPSTAASCVVERGVRHEIPEKGAPAARLCRFSLIMGLAGSLSAFFAGGTFAQSQQTSPPSLSNRLGDATAAEISVTAKPGQGPGTQAVFNVASLPPIESIGAESDIRPFLQPGIPEELTRAALCRAWVTDPAIRDFIGLSENFDARDDVPGVASSTTTDAGQLGTGGLEDRLLSAPGKSAIGLDKSGR